MGKADRISGSFWFVFSVFISYESNKMGLGVIVRSFKKRPGEGEEANPSIFGKRIITKLVLVLISLFLYALLMEWLGFLIVTLLLFIFLLGAIEKKRWPIVVLVSLIVTALSYLIFEVGLQSQLPKGPLEFLRF
jgi:phosphatidylglycerophosphate synthase